MAPLWGRAAPRCFSAITLCCKMTPTLYAWNFCRLLYLLKKITFDFASTGVPKFFVFPQWKTFKNRNFSEKWGHFRLERHWINMVFTILSQNGTTKRFWTSVCERNSELFENYAGFYDTADELCLFHLPDNIKMSEVIFPSEFHCSDPGDLHVLGCGRLYDIANWVRYLTSE